MQKEFYRSHQGQAWEKMFESALKRSSNSNSQYLQIALFFLSEKKNPSFLYAHPWILCMPLSLDFQQRKENTFQLLLMSSSPEELSIQSSTSLYFHSLAPSWKEEGLLKIQIILSSNSECDFSIIFDHSKPEKKIEGPFFSSPHKQVRYSKGKQICSHIW